ncbi:hypothetical protein Syn7502_03671 (plasmid) [Synechococcus sp. PCC 7502]|uniref:hypothetical protein n=1 Tax=Synechococcus sp. PCC 7502 TaxID=1173263 RepID=UPI00029FF5F9|nr:hypothetical protein [Synechococcus sp. PCC 7502]AFY75493.1 hypothetical protein Syn7502_03671 [Synechococcus sp. PCC 7502]
MDKQLNARVNPDLHNQIKKLSSDSKIIMNTLVETLLEIGLKHYPESILSSDTSYITKDDLISFESELLKKVESLIASASGQAKSIDGSSVKPSPVEYVPQVKNIPSPDTHPVGTELTTKEMLEYLGININSKNSKRDIDRGLKSYPDQVWQPIARGYWKRIS